MGSGTLPALQVAGRELFLALEGRSNMTRNLTAATEWEHVEAGRPRRWQENGAEWSAVGLRVSNKKARVPAAPSSTAEPHKKNKKAYVFMCRRAENATTGAARRWRQSCAAIVRGPEAAPTSAVLRHPCRLPSRLCRSKRQPTASPLTSQIPN